FGEPFSRIGNNRLQQNHFRNHADADLATLETELSRKAHCLAATVTEEFGDTSLGHRISSAMIYTISIYQSQARGALLVAEGDDGVNAEGAAGWDVAGWGGDGDEEDRNGCE